MNTEPSGLQSGLLTKVNNTFSSKNNFYDGSDYLFYDSYDGYSFSSF